jgi:hypothetical protein
LRLSRDHGAAGTLDHGLAAVPPLSRSFVWSVAW